MYVTEKIGIACDPSSFHFTDIMKLNLIYVPIIQLALIPREETARKRTSSDKRLLHTARTATSKEISLCSEVI